MSRTIQHKFGLVLSVLSEFAIDAISKNPVILQVLSEEIF